MSKSTNFAEEFKLFETLNTDSKTNKSSLKESTQPYTLKDFVWLSDSYYADKFKLAVLSYLNGASLDDALADIKGELLSAGSAPSSRKIGSTSNATSGDGEYCVVYRISSWPPSETAETVLDADSKEEAEEIFFEYMLDPDNYDEGESVLDESDITVIDIYKKP